MYNKEYNESLIKKNLPMSIRVIMGLSTFLRFAAVIEFAWGLTVFLLYASRFDYLSEEEQEEVFCSSCILTGILSIVLPSLYTIIDSLLLSNAIGAYIRNHYGAGVDDTEKKNFKAIVSLNEENTSFSAKCFGFGCCRGLGSVYQKNAYKEMIRSEDSKCPTCGNYVCFSIFPFPCIASCARSFGYDGAVLINFFVALLYIIACMVPAVMTTLCYVNETYCKDFSSSFSASVFPLNNN